MSTSKRIDIFCIVAVVITLAITILFMCGKSLGLTVLPSQEEENSGLFTENDKNGTWDTSDATTISLSDTAASIDGGGAYFSDTTLHIISAGKYVLSGALSGSVLVETSKDDKVWLMFDGVSLTNDSDAPLRIEQADKVFVTLKEGTENTLVDTNTDENATADGALFSRDDVTINGGGTLTVTSAAHHGIVCNDTLILAGGTINVTAKEDAVHAHDAIKICDTTVTVKAGDDGLHAGNDTETAVFYLQSGNITVTECYEGIEANNITIAGGTVTITPSDDGLNACGSGNSASITISGGDLTIINENGQDADGIDSNGDITLSGGTVCISLVGTGTNNAVDYGSESGGKFTITGGTLIACGSSQMVESPEQSSSQGFVLQTVSGGAGDTVSLLDSSGKTLLSDTIPCAFSSVLLSCPAVAVGDTVTLKIGDTETEVTVDNASADAGMGNMGGNKGGGMGGGRGQGETPNAENSGENGAATPPTMPNGENGDTSGERPELPSGDESGGFGGQTPPDGNFGGDTSGERPELPSGDESGGFGGQTPPGGNFGGDTSGEQPQMPSGDESGGFGGQTPPDGNFGGDTSGEQPQMPSGDENGGNREKPAENLQQSEQNTTESQDETGTQNGLETLFSILLSCFALVLGLLIVYLKK